MKFNNLTETQKEDCRVTGTLEFRKRQEKKANKKEETVQKAPTTKTESKKSIKDSIKNIYFVLKIIFSNIKTLFL